MDETYASRLSGAFHLSGCAEDPFGSQIDPELRVYHKCKSRERMLTVVLPRDKIGGEHNLTALLNLQAISKDEVDRTFPASKCPIRRPAWT